MSFASFLEGSLVTATTLKAVPIYDLCIEAFRAMHALSYGPHPENQLTIVGSEVCGVANRIFQKITYSLPTNGHTAVDVLDPKKTELKLAIMRMIHTGLEGDHEVMIKTFNQNIQWGGVLMQMNDTFKAIHQVESRLESDSMDPTGDAVDPSLIASTIDVKNGVRQAEHQAHHSHLCTHVVRTHAA